ncbi:MupA/Atu3671 family FMN-dependent luciferase-like monooxygenase [Sorangium sp. So ce269]
MFRTGIDEIDPRAPFLEMGADSLALTEIVRIIQTTYGLKLSIRQFFEETTTLAALARYIDERLPEGWTQSASAPAESGPRPEKPVAQAPSPVAQAPSPVAQAPSPVVLPAVAPAMALAPVVFAPPSSSPGELQLPRSEIAALLGQQLQVVSQLVSRQLALLSGRAVTLSADPQVPALAPAPASTAEPPRPAPRSQGSAPDHSHGAASHGTSTNGTASHGASTNGTASHGAPTNGAAQAAPLVTSRGLGARQQQHLEALVERYNRRTRRSKELTQRHRAHLADSRATVGFRFSTKEMLYPIVGERAAGTRIWDVDGNEYVDLTMGFGVHLFGNRPEFISEAIRQQLENGVDLGPRSPAAGEVAELVCQLTGHERAVFCNSGTEAIMSAIRLVRARTGRSRIAIFSGSYHGHSDGTLAERDTSGGPLDSSPVAPGIPRGVASDVVVLDYGAPASIELLRAHGKEIAAVLVEPVQSRHLDLQPAEFLRELRQVTRETGTALFFDEMISGFRVHPAGAQGHFGIQADIATYGKIVGGGMPIGVVAGRAEYLNGIDGGPWQYGDRSYPKEDMTFFGGTFCQHPLAMVAARAVLQRLRDEGPSLQQRVSRMTSDFARAANEIFTEFAAPIRIEHFGSQFRFGYTGNMDLLFYHLLERGVYIWEWRNCFLSTAHTAEDMSFVLDALRSSLEDLRSGGFLESAGPVPIDSPLRAKTSPAALKSGSAAAAATTDAVATAAAATTTAAAATIVEPSARRIPRFVERRRGESAAMAGEGAIVAPRTTGRPVELSLSFFGKYDADFRRDKYDLLFESCQWADQRGFPAVWLPERHFHAFGGLSPNPSVLAAALARTTKNLRLRAGSVVLPLHSPIRVAEEWAVVDNLSGGRVDVALASGWHPDDFVFAPGNYGNQREITFRDAEVLRKLWRGEPVSFPGGTGKPVEVRIHPRPMQAELPLWLTIVNNPETYVKAGQLGLGVLTNLMGQSHEDLARNISLYRKALADNGWAPERGHVTVLVHTFVAETDDAARAAARRPFNEYLQSSIGLFRNLVKSEQLDIDFDDLTADDREYICDRAFARYLDGSLLVGSPASCEAVARGLSALGVDEVAAFIDFGVGGQKVMDSLPLLDEVRRRCERAEPAPRASGAAPEIGRAPRRQPLLASQQQMWVLSQISPEGATSYTDLAAIELRGALDVPALKAALEALVRRHEALRSWVSDDGLTLLIAGEDEVALDVPIVALPDDEAARAWLRSHSAAPIDLHRAPVLQVHLLALGDRRHVLALRAHHVLVDGWSLGNLVGELGHLYTEARAGRPAELPPAAQFGEFARWQAALEGSERWAEDEAYWLSRLSGPLPTPQLPADRPRPAVMSFRGERQTLHLDARLVRLAGEVSRKHGCTPFMFFFAAYALLLRRLCQQRDLLVGVAVGGRPAELGEGLVGSMSQLLPIRLDGPRDGAFADLLRAARGTLLEAFEHQAYPYARLVQKLGAGQDLSRAPIVSAVFNYDRPLSVPGFADLEARALPRDIGYARYDLYLNVMTIGGEVELECDYSTDLFDPASIRRYLEAYAHLLEQICEDPRGRLSEYALVTGEDEQRLLVAWNATAKDAPAWLPVHRQIEARAQETPDAIAITVEADLADGSSVPAQALTYAELDRRASRLAAALRAKGAGPESRVAILAPRSPDLIVGLLGILKAGAAFLPLDPAYPANRLTWMLEDAGARLLVTVRSHAGALPGATAERVLVDEIAAGAAEPGADVLPENLAYLMYTSGSTGRPKGVMISHEGLADYLRWCRDVYPVTEGEGTPLHGSIAFDATLTSIFPALCAGRSVFVVPDDHEIEGLVRALRGGRRFSFVKLTPSHLGLLAELSGGANLLERTGAVILGGEALTEAPLAPWKERAPRLRVLNEYGPTEAVVGCALHEGWEVLPLSGGASIGRPAANTQLHVLDEQMRLLPPGVIGELYIGGICLARGYNQAPALTAQRFVPNPFAGRSPGAAPGSRLYRTGDRARFLPDGTLEFLGRLDDQVKIRGFRVELGEIAAVLGQHPRVQGAVAVVRGEHLVAYVSSDAAGTGDEAPLRSALRERLRETLPAHMVPGDIVVLASLPLTVNGKVDAARLPEPSRENPDAAEADRAPRSELEARIAAVWRDLLGLDRVGIHQNFFDLGGHSHLVVRAHRRLVEETGRSVPVVEMFRHPTVATLATLFGETSAEGARAKAAGEDKDARARARKLALEGQRQRAQKGRS